MPHSRKILSQAGTSLADVYDVEGSVVGLEALDVNEIKGVHDLGPQIHSERLNAFNLVANSGGIAQNTNWRVTLGSFPDSINRILAVSIIADTAARVNHCQVSLTDSDGLDHPISIWDSADDTESNIRWQSPATVLGVALRSSLSPFSTPLLIVRTGAAWLMPDITFTGNTLGFGAGAVTTRALILVVRPDHGNPPAGAPSSHGLPIPSW